MEVDDDDDDDDDFCFGAGASRFRVILGMTVFLGIFAADDDDDDDDAAATAAAAIDCGGILSVGEEGRGGLSL